MATKCAIEQLFAAAESRSVNKHLIDEVRCELDILDRIKLSKDDKEKLKDLRELLRDVSNKQYKSAKKKCSWVKEYFSSHLKIPLQDYKRSIAARGGEKNYPEEPLVDYDKEPNYHGYKYQQHDTNRNGRQNRDDHRGQRDLNNSSSEEQTTYPDYKMSVAQADEETVLIRKSQKASQALRHNNPDIADLSDSNRPTKIAERFSELYDNEWVEAFDALSNKRKTEEKKITQLLLKIVEEAYAFCKEKAERELLAMHSAIMDILEFGEVEGKSSVNKQSKSVDVEKIINRSLLVQYRKEYASRAIKRLEKEFFEMTLSPICTNALGGMPPAASGPTAKYGRKAVELSWWMCVQDPPVHMVSTKESFKPDLYKGYTKSGTRPDFIVWPALKLHESGGLMTKGVVQYQ